MTDHDATDGETGGVPEAGAPTGPGPAAGPADTEPAPLDRAARNRTARFAWIAVAVLLIGVIGLVTYALTSTQVIPEAVQRTPAAPDVLTGVSRVPASVFDTVGVVAAQTSLVPPAVLSGQPPLRASGKPEVLYVGAEYCPFCGAERWPLVVALSRFGRFTGLKDMQSAPLSVFPGTATFSFVGAHYASRYLTFTGIELYSDALDAGGSYVRIATLTPAQAQLVARYGRRSTAPTGRYPFVDVDNLMVASTAAFSPAVLTKGSQATIAGGLGQPTNPTTQAIVAAANQLTAGLCAATGGRPEAVCSSKGAREAAVALGLP